jgi:hypothetical protein
MFVAHAKRKAIERVHEVKAAMIAGVWSNSNYDGEADTRTDLLRKIDVFVETATNSIYGVEEVEEEEDFENNPFFAAMKIPGIEQIDHHKDRDRVSDLP